MPAIQAPTRISISNILWTTDFSKASRNALPYVSALAQLYGAKVFVVHVLSPDPHLGVPLDRLPHEADIGWQDAKQNLANLLTGEQPPQFPHEEILERGELWDVISGIIADKKIDLVVV